MTCRIRQMGMMGLEYTDLFWIMVLWDQNPVDSSGVQWIPVNSGPIPLDSTGFRRNDQTLTGIGGAQ